MHDLHPEFVPAQIIEKSTALLLSTYLFRDMSSPITDATIKAAELAKAYNVPIVCAMGTKSLVKNMNGYLKEFLKKYVTVVAMNADESEALTYQSDALLAAQECLDIVDLILITVGSKGLYLGGYCNREYLRKTDHQLHTKSIVEYNKYEYSRPMRRRDCKDPVKIYTHFNPYMGGPLKVSNTNGAGDAALSAILHDMAANNFHKNLVTNSPKHRAPFLTYSSLAQIGKYANRVSYEVISQKSPRLIKGLPEREDNLTEEFWSN